ncbi:MAG: PstS family phosphate ABC transporter substrate-binding protein [Dehalococcoidia bacterium]|nr:PstS family phosphate ABC transporter substrate-binding protein [Dehalococcoidia bacterium]
MKRRIALAAGVVLALAAVVVAASSCSLDRPAQVRIDGSSTVFPISEALAEDYSKGRRVQVKVGISGTGGGLEKFCRGEIDVAAASRAIKDTEVQACAEEGITDIVELSIAIDALTVLVSAENDFVQCLRVDEVAAIFREGGANHWNEVRPEWPDHEITLYHPGADSGTFDYFVEAVIHAQDENWGHRTDGNASEDDNVILLGVGGDRYGAGYVGFAYYQENAGEVRAVAIDNGDGCVEPTTETALSGEYAPLSRHLFYYTRKSTLVEEEAVREFFAYAYDNLDRLTAETGYITLPEAEIAEARAHLREAEQAAP